MQTSDNIWQILEYSDGSCNQLISVTDLRVIPTNGASLESPALLNGVLKVTKENSEVELTYRAPEECYNIKAISSDDETARFVQCEREASG